MRRTTAVPSSGFVGTHILAWGAHSVSLVLEVGLVGRWGTFPREGPLIVSNAEEQRGVVPQ